MEKLKLTYVGKDYWSRKVYQDENGNYYKDISLSCDEPKELHTSCPRKDFEGEPDYPITNFEIVNPPPKLLILEEQNKFNYMMLSKYQSNFTAYFGILADGTPKELPDGDCRYHNTNFAGEPSKALENIKEFWAKIPNEVKPEWCTAENISSYEAILAKSV